MKKIHIIILVMALVIPISISQVYAQTLYTDVKIGDMDKIDKSKYIASGVSVLRDSNGVNYAIGDKSSPVAAGKSQKDFKIKFSKKIDNKVRA